MRLHTHAYSSPGVESWMGVPNRMRVSADLLLLRSSAFMSSEFNPAYRIQRFSIVNARSVFFINDVLCLRIFFFWAVTRSIHRVQETQPCVKWDRRRRSIKTFHRMLLAGSSCVLSVIFFPSLCRSMIIPVSLWSISVASSRQNVSNRPLSGHCSCPHTRHRTPTMVPTHTMSK
jgi:hypothetical protein